MLVDIDAGWKKLGDTKPRLGINASTTTLYVACD